MRDQIRIEGLELSAQLGVPETERSTPQRLTAFFVIEPLRGLRDLGDQIENTVDYFTLTRSAQRIARERPRHLLETLAEDIAAGLLAEFPLSAVELELRKYILPDTAFVAVKVRREKRGLPSISPPRPL